MKNSILCCSLLIAVTLFIGFGCSKDSTSKVNSDGLTKDITDLVPDSMLTTMKSLGFPIFGGENPPDIQNTFFVTKFILKSSNRPGDIPGYKFSDMSISFSEQDNEALTIKVDYVNGPESGHGLGSFIVGEGNKFTVFTRIDAITNGHQAKVIYVYSGELDDCGIQNFYASNFMVDDFGDPGNIYIENGQGRVIYDEDGFSEIISTVPKINYQVPNGVPQVYQPTQNTCWAASFTMMLMWHDNTSYQISTALAKVAPKWKAIFEQDRGLSDVEWNELNKTAGLTTVLYSPTVQGLANLLKKGPLLVAVDEDTGPGFAGHIKVITGISGQGGPGCTDLSVNDPWQIIWGGAQGGQYTEKYDVFMNKIAQAMGTDVLPIVHW